MSVTEQRTLPAGVIPSRTGLHIPEGLTFEQWEGVGKRLYHMIEATLFAVGDWLQYGEFRYGEKYRAALEQFEVTYGQARTLAYVAGNVPPTVRRADLSWTHHRIVAKLLPAEQAAWLERASTEQLSTRELVERLSPRGDNLGTGEEQPALPPRLATQVHLSPAPEQLQRWQVAAERDGLGVVEWATVTLDEAA